MKEIDYEKFIGKRLRELRKAKQVSAHEMSIAIGCNKNYINNIENGLSLPKMQYFLYICEYLGVTPAEFFDPDNADPKGAQALYEDFKRLDISSQQYIRQLIAEIQKRPR